MEMIAIVTSSSTRVNARVEQTVISWHFFSQNSRRHSLPVGMLGHGYLGILFTLVLRVSQCASRSTGMIKSEVSHPPTAFPVKSMKVRRLVDDTECRASGFGLEARPWTGHASWRKITAIMASCLPDDHLRGPRAGISFDRRAYVFFAIAFDRPL